MRLATAILAALIVLAPAAEAGSYALIDKSSAWQADAAIMSAKSRASAIRALRKVPSVGVINLNVRSSFRFREDQPDVSEFRIMAAKHATGIKNLRTALRSNPVTRKALQSRGIAIDKIVGVQIGTSGSLRLYLL